MSIKKLFFKEKQYLYIKVYENKIVATDLDSRKEIECIAKQLFSTQRLLIGNFENTVACLKEVLAGFSSSDIKPMSLILIQPMEKSEKISHVEKQVLEELALEAASTNLYIPVVKLNLKENLSNEEALQLLKKG